MKQTYWFTSGSPVTLELFASPLAGMYFVPGRCQAEQLCLTSKLLSASWVPHHGSYGLRFKPRGCSLQGLQQLKETFALLVLCSSSTLEMAKLPSASACTGEVSASLTGGLLTLCWFRRNCMNIFHLFTVAELCQEPYSPPLLPIP